MPRDGESLRQEQLAARQRRLRAIEAEAAQGLKLDRTSDRLRASLELTRAWWEAKRQGLRKEVFQDEVLDALTRGHAGRGEFRLDRYLLTRSDAERMAATGITAEDVAAYRTRREPQKSLDAYLTGLRVAARHCGADPDDWTADMLRGTSLWLSQGPLSTQPRQQGVFEDGQEDAEADIPAETLAILLNQMARHLAQANRLPELIASVAGMPCRWEMFEERLVPSSWGCMDRVFAATPPAEGAVYFEEMVPFPSVPLVRVPLLVHEATLGLVPNAPLAVPMEGLIATTAYALATGAHPVDDVLPIVGLPSNEDVKRIDGRVVVYREVRLAIAPVDRHGWGAVLEFRPCICIDLPAGDDMMRRQLVWNAVDPDLLRPHFYPLHEEGRLVWPTIQIDGEVRRVVSFGVRSNPSEEPDPVEALWQPGPLIEMQRALGDLEPWYLTYAAVTGTEVRAWLASVISLDDGAFGRPWSHVAHASDAYQHELPPDSELYFPRGDAATDVERCLHNGFLQRALQNAIDSLASDAATLQSALATAREDHAQRLLNRWRSAPP